MISLNELLVVVIVGILVSKPSDIKIILKQFYAAKRYLSKIYKEIIGGLQIDEKHLLDQDIDINELNFYLKKITELGKSYNGIYDLASVREYYFELLKEVKGKDSFS